jgi:hypothetical protein
VTGGDGKDTITTGSGNDTIVGGAGNDTINAGDGNNNVDGGADNDSITTGAGDDTIFGGDGNDTINAGNGVNTIKGGAGLDTLTGGTGVDTYIYTAVTDSQGVTVDVITNFTVGATGDVIDLSAVNAAGVFAGTANGYGAVLTTLAAGTAMAVFDSSTGTLYFDANADGALTTADMAIQLTGVTTGLVAANFDFVVLVFGACPRRKPGAVTIKPRCCKVAGFFLRINRENLKNGRNRQDTHPQWQGIRPRQPERERPCAVAQYPGDQSGDRAPATAHRDCPDCPCRLCPGLAGRAGSTAGFALSAAGKMGNGYF